MEIRELIELGKENVQIERAMAEAAHQEHEEELRREREQKEKAFRDMLLGGLPEILRPYADLSKITASRYDPEKHVPLRVEGCTYIQALYLRPQGEDEPWKLNGYMVWIPKAIDHHHYELDYVTQRFRAKDLERVLGTAALAREQELKMQAQVDQEKAAHEAQQAKWAAEQEAAELDRLARRQEQEAKEEAELQEVFDLIRNHRVALALVRAFAAADQIIGHMDELLRDADEAAASAEHHYEERLQVARRDAQSAADQARELERRAWDAEEKARQLEREAKLAQRGW